MTRAQSQWDLIKNIINECDYYIVIIGGRYGTIDSKTGKSYTQLEYEYACEQGVPTIGFIYQSPELLPAKHVEQSQEGKDKLDGFKKLLLTKTCKFWNNAGNLSSSVVLSLLGLQNSHPRCGWIKGNTSTTDEIYHEITVLRKKNDEMQKTIELYEKSTQQIELHTNKNDRLMVVYEVKIPIEGNDSILENKYCTEQVELLWSKIFYFLAPVLSRQAIDNDLQRRLNSLITSEDMIKLQTKYSKYEYYRVDIEQDFYNIIKEQFIVMGLIARIKDDSWLSSIRWILTNKGKEKMGKISL